MFSFNSNPMRKPHLSRWKWPAAWLASLLCFMLMAGSTPWPAALPVYLQQVLAQWQHWTQQVPEEKVYVHLDRPFYQPGESLWFTAYVRQGSDLRPSPVSDVVHVELRDPKGGVLQAHRMLVQAGRAQGEFALPAGSPGGRYTLRAYTQWMTQEAEPAIFEKEVMVQAVVTPRLKMKLDFEREAYGPGAHGQATLVLEGLDNAPLRRQTWQYQLKAGGEILSQGQGQTDETGQATIAFALPAALATPAVLLQVTVPYQGLTESISRAVPVVWDQIDLAFFPEGGDMVAGCRGRVAFRARDAHGQPADVAGYILDAAGDTVTAFRSFHHGMGACWLEPAPGQQYQAVLTEPFVSTQRWELPRPLPRGYSLRVDSISQTHAHLQVLSSEPGPIGLVATVRGQVVFAGEKVVTPGATAWTLSLADFPMGVAQFTLIDDRKIPRAERLAFVNTHRQMRIDVQTDRAQYLPRDEVTVTLRTTDDRGLPLPAQLSLAVVDDRLRHFADDQRSTLLSWLLLESDIREEVDEPAFYFDPEETKAAQARDYLLMTAGWRRFTWQAVASGTPPPVPGVAEQARIAGSLRDLRGLPVIGAEVWVGDFRAKTDDAGSFDLRGLHLHQAEQLRIALPAKHIQIVRHLRDYETGLHIRVGDVKGQVVDTAGQALPGAQVGLGGTSQTGVTDAEGRFRLTVALLAGETPYLEVQRAGYQGAKQAIPFGREPEPFTFALVERPVPLPQRYRRQPMATGVQPAPFNDDEVELEVAVNRAEAAMPVAGWAVPDAVAVPAPAAPLALEEPVVAVRDAVEEVPKEAAAPAIWAEDLVEEGPAIEPDIAEFIWSDEVAAPINLDQVRQQIGYPARAREAAIEGTVVVRVLVDKKGQYQQHEVVSSAHPLLSQAIAPYVAALQFAPAIQGGRPQDQWVQVPFRFRLDDAASTPVRILDVTPAAVWAQPVPQYYRVRQYPVQRYGAGQPETFRRADFRQTLHWDGLIETDRRGEAQVRFFTSDALTAFHLTVEGIGMDGSPGRATHTFFSQLPFALDVRMPPLLTAHDTLEVPLTLVNHTASAQRGRLSVTWPRNLIPLGDLPDEVRLPAGAATTLYLPCRVDTLALTDSLTVAFRSRAYGDAMTVPVQSRLRGFPARLAFSGDQARARYQATITDLVPGSLRARLIAYPDVAGEVLEGLEGMLREPHGCFEQTSSTTYPNLLVLRYLEETGQDQPAVRARAEALIAQGYARLLTFETSAGGFEWFGKAPGHEALTAYGLMEFADMARVYEGVDPALISRTAAWLLDRRDGSGGFTRNPRALHQFGLADEVTTSVYITYALSEAGITGIEREVDYAVQQAQRQGTPYLLALAANILLNQGRAAEAAPLLADLKALSLTAPAAREEATLYTAPGSGGLARQIEVNALALLAHMRAASPDRGEVHALAGWLRAQRSGAGTFGSTHSTVLALRALLAHARYARRTQAAGTLVVRAGGQPVARQAYAAGREAPIVLEGLEAALGEGTYDLEVVFEGGALPYTLALDWVTDLPVPAPACAVGLRPQLHRTELRMGETVRLDLNLENLQAVGQGMTMAIVGLPAGLSAQPWQLEALLEEEQVAFYELVGQELYLYFRQMEPGQVRQLGLDLKAEVPGTFVAQASRAYLYYTDEHKDWQLLPPVTIRR